MTVAISDKKSQMGREAGSGSPRQHEFAGQVESTLSGESTSARDERGVDHKPIRDPNRDARPTVSKGKAEVRCRSGYKGDEYPVGFTLEGQEYEVREILESRIEEDSETRARRRVFVVETDEGVRFRLVQRDDGWHCSKGATDTHR